MKSNKKPSYHIPSMKKINKIPYNGFNVVSTFSGGGGSCLGYRMSGYKILYANEFVEEARNTYKANFKSTFVDDRDIRDVTGADILSITKLQKGELDLFDGSPPCCAFSMAGSREKSWNKIKSYSDNKKQRVDDLFFEYIRILNDLQPKVFIAENVQGIISGNAKIYFNKIYNDMQDCGYNVGASLLDAAFLGVPQRRKRVIFIGVRKDLKIRPSFPKPFDYYYTLSDALTGVQNNDKEVEELREEALLCEWGKYLRRMPKNPKRCIKGSKIANGSYFNLSRESYFEPCSTICQANGQKRCSGNCHPNDNRKFTIAELKRITSLPDDFILTGSFSQQWERCGRMVPPMMMKNISQHILNTVLCKMT